MRKKIKESVVVVLNLPKDICLGDSVVTVTGRREVFVENYKGIIECCGTRIVLKGKNCKICVTGSQLAVDYYTGEDMKITGVLDCVQYC